MKYVFIDDSIHVRGNFIISGFVFSEINPQDLVGEILFDNGINPEQFEFKSGLSFRKHPEMIIVRDKLKTLLTRNCQIGLVVLPIDKRIQIGEETLKGLKQFIDSNNFDSELNIYIDENYFKSKVQAKNLTEKYNFKNCNFHFEQNSKLIRGIQLADIVAHTCSIMLLENLGILDKIVKVFDEDENDTGYEVSIGFEMWATIRYIFLHESFTENDGFEPIFNVKPYGLYISDYCNSNLKETAEKTFGKVYFGCIN